jgi:hypothetical protein
MGGFLDPRCRGGGSDGHHCTVSVDTMELVIVMVKLVDMMGSWALLPLLLPSRDNNHSLLRVICSQPHQFDWIS